MKRRIAVALAGVVGAVVLVFSGPAGSAAPLSRDAAAHGSPASWPQYGFSASRQFYQPGETVLGRGNVAKLKRSFVTIWGTSSSPPVLAGGVLYESACVYDDQTGLYNCMIGAQNASSGATVWTHRVLIGAGTPAVPSVAVDGNRVIVPFVGSKVEAVDAATGKSVLWTAGLPLAAVPAVANGTVYAPGTDGKLYALSEATGAQLWSVQLGLSVSQPPAVAAGIVYAGSDDGTLHAVNAATGAPLWSAKVAGALTAYPSAGDGMVFASASNGGPSSAFYAFDAKTGTLRWHIAAGPQSHFQWVAVDPANVYVVDNDPGTIHAFAALTGRKLWTASPLGGLAGGTYEPVIANGVVYAGTSYAIDAYNTTTGAHVARIALDTAGASCAFPQYSVGVAIAGAVVYSDCEAWTLPKTSH